MLWIHITAGFVALLAGFIALYARKGGDTHRGYGRVFALAMVAMTGSGAFMAALLRPNPGNVLAACTTLYLVASGWSAVRDQGRNPRLDRVLAGFGVLVALYGGVVASIAFQAPGRAIGGIPAVVMAVFALVCLAAAIADFRRLARASGEAPARVLRHLWRMGLALWIATMSFFLGQADEFPRAVRASGVLAIPVLVVAGTVVYWSVRQARLARRSRRATLRAAAAAGPA